MLELKIKDGMKPIIGTIETLLYYRGAYKLLKNEIAKSLTEGEAKILLSDREDIEIIMFVDKAQQAPSFNWLHEHKAGLVEIKPMQSGYIEAFFKDTSPVLCKDGNIPLPAPDPCEFLRQMNPEGIIFYFRDSYHKIIENELQIITPDEAEGLLRTTNFTVLNLGSSGVIGTLPKSCPEVTIVNLHPDCQAEEFLTELFNRKFVEQVFTENKN